MHKLLITGRSLNRKEMAAAMDIIMQGGIGDDELEQFLTALSERGETVEELAGAAEILRSKVKTITAPPHAIDCCGTGGDDLGTYNISTACAFVIAACGIPIAKHGNRAASSRSGAADVLEAMGINLDLPVTALEQALREFNFCFLMAPRHHQAMAHVRSVRQKMKTRTIFNLLGPLANPAGTKRQLIGVFHKKWVIPLARTLKTLGTERAWVVHGADGLDEVSISGPTFAALLDNRGVITEHELSPQSFGLAPSPIGAIKGGDAKANADALLSLLNGRQGAYYDIVIANAALAITLYENDTEPEAAAAKAAQAIDSGKALRVFEHYKEFSQRHHSAAS